MQGLLKMRKNVIVMQDQKIQGLRRKVMRMKATHRKERAAGQGDPPEGAGADSRDDAAVVGDSGSEGGGSVTVQDQGGGASFGRREAKL